MKLRTALPSGLTNKMVKRFDPSRMGGDLLIRFVPTSPKGEDGKEANQIKITISSKISKYYNDFKEILKRNKKGESKSLLGNTKKPNSKLCQLCAKHAPGVKNTHNDTAQCRKFNTNGSEQRRAYKEPYSKHTNAHSHDGEDIVEVFSQMRKR